MYTYEIHVKRGESRVEGHTTIFVYASSKKEALKKAGVMREGEAEMQINSITEHFNLEEPQCQTNI